jgi:hypothetical protein
MQTTLHPITGEELMAYLDGEVIADRALFIQKHIEGCRECQSVAADFQAVSREMREWQIEDASITLQASDVAGGGARDKPLWIRSRGMWAAATVIVIVVLMVQFRQTELKDKRAWLADYSPLVRRSKNGVIGGVVSNSSAGLLVPAQPPPSGTVTGPMIIRTADMKLTTRAFDGARSTVQRTVGQFSGYVAELSVSAKAGEARTLQASLRVPAAQLDSFMAALRALGRVTYESQRGEDVTKQFVDLNARLNNARNTEQRLTKLLRDRTGKLADVLAVEEQIDNVRGRIESMEAEVKSMSNQVAFSSVDLTVTEEYDVPLSDSGSPPVIKRLRNAAVEGYHNVIGAVVACLSFLLSAGPVLLLVAAVLFFPVRAIWRKNRAS